MDRPQGCPTNGIGIRSIRHLNLTKSMADVDARKARKLLYNSDRKRVERKTAQLLKRLGQ